MTAATTPDIAPRRVGGEPVFSGDASRPFWNALRRVKGEKTYATLYDYGCRAQEMESELEALRRQRDALQAERDAARRELCAVVAMEAPELYPTQRDVAASRDWSYLYEVKP